MTGMEEAPENGKESSHSAHANGMNENELTEMFSNSTSVCYKCNISTVLQFLIDIHFNFLFPLNLILFNFKKSSI